MKKLPKISRIHQKAKTNDEKVIQKLNKNKRFLT